MLMMAKSVPTRKNVVSDFDGVKKGFADCLACNMVANDRLQGRVPAEDRNAPPNEAYRIHCGIGGVSPAGEGGRVGHFAVARKRSPNVATSEGK